MKTLKILVAVVLVIAVSAFAIDKVNLSDSDAGYVIGDVATDFSLKNIDDTTVSLADYKDAKGFIVIFTCNHCPYSVAYEDRIIELDKAFKDKGYPVIAINPNNPKAYPTDSFDNMKVRAKEKGFTFPYLFDDGQKIYPQYGATKTPHVYILEKTANGNVVRYIGAIDNNYKDASAADKKYAEDAINALLKGEKVPVETTKAIGCSIKA
ncbi:thioredoxin family protein [Aquimarina sp. AD1]|uniref:thioredoxin family protein n=1 Tax=Aquimarina sp. (strain AD1) TaxID=1714848 RepID=UPI000E4F8053|nr:thioredoxin family protein [Aquimarina sp. AD1]AXT56230.1 thioredoxin family protein [Aquimarina sp. AD1]RKN19401.1 thioredoxin family protein [Aquimarina sp. AD1]